MMPFPETEIMTIKRLEVALRKMDLKLLKDGAYKLHEKFHSGHVFEYTDLLKEMLEEIETNPKITDEIKNILSSTIKDIFKNQDIEEYGAQNPINNKSSIQTSSLTSLSYNTSNEAQNKTEELEKNPTKINAFDAFKSDKIGISSMQELKEENIQTPQAQINTIQEQKEQYKPIFSNQSPFSAQPFQEFKKEQTYTPSYLKDKVQVQHNFQQNLIQTPEEKIKSVAIFYSQENSEEKIKNILQYRKLITQSFDTKLEEIIKLIFEINLQTNANIIELRNILTNSKIKENKINLVTNSISSALIQLLKQEEMEYSLNSFNLDEKLNVIPYMGLSNLFKCQECGYEFLDTNEEITPYILQCPNCKKAMYPEFYAYTKQNPQINLDNYNKSLIALSNSKVWLIIHPKVQDEITLNMLTSALSMSCQLEEIYIADKDINVRETYKKAFENINKNVKINIQMNAVEDFIKMF